MKKILYSAASLTLLFFSCKPKLDVPAAGKGSLNLTTYVAIGNSATAGYADNALYRDAQLVAYPNLIAGQLKLAGGGEFKQPLVSAASQGMGSLGNARFALAPFSDCSGAISLAPLPVQQSGDATIFQPIGSQGPFNNMGVPGLKASMALLGGYGYTNPFYQRFSSDVNASVISDAVAQNPTLFSLSLGDDDVMGYALSGGYDDAITDDLEFNESIDLIVADLTANGAKGVIANIPHISKLPYFTTVPFNGLLLDESSAQGLTAVYSNAIEFHPGYNAFVIEDADAPSGFRQIAENEYILLSVPQEYIKCQGWGSTTPIPDQYVLKASEIANITAAIEKYNTKLQSVALDRGLAFVDVDAFMSKIKSGITFNGVAVRSEFVTGGAFSLDGVHLTPLGNALLANEFIKSLNLKYGSSIPQVDATKYKGVTFP